MLRLRWRSDSVLSSSLVLGLSDFSFLTLRRHVHPLPQACLWRSVDRRRCARHMCSNMCMSRACVGESLGLAPHASTLFPVRSVSPSVRALPGAAAHLATEGSVPEPCGNGVCAAGVYAGSAWEGWG